MKKYLSLLFITLLIIFGYSACKNEAAPAAADSTPTPDTGGPVITFVNPGEGDSVSGEVSFAGVAEDSSAIQSVTIQIDGVDILDPGSITITGHYWNYPVDTLSQLLEGAHSITAQAVDEHGNWGEAVTLNFTIDHDYPEVLITAPLHGSIIRGTVDIDGIAAGFAGITITSVKVDATENSQYLDAIGTANWTYTFDSTTVADGSLILKALATASNDNSSIVSSGVTVDNTPPVITITSHLDGESVQGAIILQGTTVDAGGVDTVEIKIDSDPNEPTTGTISWSKSIDTTSYLDGVHTVTVTAYDTAGNLSQQSISLYVDQTPPVIAIVAPAADSHEKGDGISITGTVTDYDLGDTLEIAYNGGAYSAVDNYNFSSNGNWNHILDTLLDGLADGLLTVTLKETALGGSGAVYTQSINYYVDNTEPSGAISSPADASAVAGTVLITGTAADNLALPDPSGVVIDISDGTTSIQQDLTASMVGSQWTYSWDTTAYTGACTIDVTITDAAGNFITESIGVTKDVNTPSVTIDNPVNGGIMIVKSGTDFVVSGTALDTTGTFPGVAKVEVQVDALGYVEADSYDQTLPYSAGTVTWSYTTSSLDRSDGAHTVYALVTDGDNNTSQVAITIIADNTPPTVAINYPTSGNTGNNFLYSTVSASGTATDTYLDTVEVQVDSQPVAAAVGTSSWSYSWDTAAYPGARNGTVFKVIAADTAGNTGEATVTVDVRPKITGLSTTSELTGQTITINGFNFNDALPNFNVFFEEGAGVVAGTPAGTTATTITVPIPATATSGDVYIQEGATIIQSNGVHLDVWEQQSVTNTGKANRQSLFVSGSNTYQLIYRGGNIKEIWFSKNSAAAVLLDAVTASFPSVAADSTNVYLLHIANNNLRFMRSANSGGDSFPAPAITEPVSATAAQAATSIALYPAVTTIGIAYNDTSGNLKYIESGDNGVSWGAAETVDSVNTGIYASLSLAFDSSGTPCIAYYDSANTQAKFAYHNGSSWVTSLIESSSYHGQHISLAIASDDSIHVSYYNGYDAELKYAYAPDYTSSFTITEVDSFLITGFDTAITVDGSDQPHIAYLNWTTSTIYYSYYDGSSWQTLSVPASIGVANNTGLSIGIAASGYIHIGYIDSIGSAQIIYRP